MLEEGGDAAKALRKVGQAFLTVGKTVKEVTESVEVDVN